MSEHEDKKPADLTRLCSRRPRTSGRGKRKAGPLWEGGRFRGARLDDRSDCSITAGQSKYAKWRIFVCQEATFADVAPLQEDGVERGQGFQRAGPGRRGEAPTGLWTTEFSILAVKRCKYRL
jgi:hypothetical protein